ncbi:MAG: zinc-binding alcohol dehydrogenase family protein [Pyrinomonadaceae bacterium]
MRSIILEEPGRLSMTSSAAAPELKLGEALVRPRRVGICGTDLHAFVGKQPFFNYPRVLGHELGVEIISVPENKEGLTPGDLCAVEPYLNCEQCIACRRKRPNCCVRMQVVGVHVDGGMRELIAVPIRKLHKSNTLSLDQLALVEPLSIGAHAVGRAELEPGEVALVIGAGPIGLAVALFAQLAKARVLVMDVNQARLDFCHQLLGAHSIIANPSNVVAQLEQTVGGDLPTTVFDATGNQQSMAEAFNYVAHSGQLIFVGLFQGTVSFDDPNFHRRELTLMSSRNATAKDFRDVMTRLENGQIEVASWISHRTVFTDVPREFPGWVKRESAFIKAVVEL